MKSSPRTSSARSSPTTPRGCTSQKTRVLSRRISQHFDHVIAASGLKTTQYSLLSGIVNLGPMRPGDLARTMNLDASTLTRNLQPLIAAGWVVIGPGDDERSRRVEATESGRRKRADAQRAWKRAQLAFNERVGEAAVARLHSAIDDCMALLDANEGPPAAH